MAAEEVVVLEFSVILLGLHQTALLDVDYFPEAIWKAKEQSRLARRSGE